MKSLVAETFRIDRASVAFLSSTALDGSTSRTTWSFGALLRFAGLVSVVAPVVRFARGALGVGVSESIVNCAISDCGGTLLDQLSSGQRNYGSTVSGQLCHA